MAAVTCAGFSETTSTTLLLGLKKCRDCQHSPTATSHTMNDMKDNRAAVAPFQSFNTQPRTPSSATLYVMTKECQSIKSCRFLHKSHSHRTLQLFFFLSHLVVPSRSRHKMHHLRRIPCPRPLGVHQKHRFPVALAGHRFPSAPRPSSSSPSKSSRQCTFHASGDVRERRPRRGVETAYGAPATAAAPGRSRRSSGDGRGGVVDVFRVLIALVRFRAQISSLTYPKVCE